MERMKRSRSATNAGSGDEGNESCGCEALNEGVKEEGVEREEESDLRNSASKRRRESLLSTPGAQEKEGQGHSSTTAMAVEAATGAGTTTATRVTKVTVSDVAKTDVASEVSADGGEISIRMLADSLPQLVWVTRTDGYHEYYNQRWWDYTGLDREVAARDPGGGWSIPLHPDDKGPALARWVTALGTLEPYEIEYRFRRASDGQFRWFLGRAMPWKDSKGNVVKWFGTCTDIHDQKQANVALKRAKEELETSARAKDEFLAMISHELRTPLNAVLGWAQLLRLGELDEEESKRAIETIEESASLQAQLIEDLLDVTRIVNNKLAMDLKPLELVGLVKSAIYNTRLAAQQKKIDVSLEVIGADDLVVNADPFRMQQIVSNILTNAIKFTPEGGSVFVTVDRSMSSARIKVTDTGKGIAKDFLPYVFDRFRQADSSSTRHYGGLGLGLTIVKHLVNLHGGTITATSEGAFKGSTFSVLLPIVAVKPEFVTNPRLYLPSTTSVESVEDSAPVPLDTLNGLRILVVDDEPSAREVIASTLRKYGAQVLDLDRAEKVLKFLSIPTEEFSSETQAGSPNPSPSLEDFPIAVLVSDVAMPAMDGLSMIRRIRTSTSPHATLPALALTAHASIEDKSKALHAGYDDYLSKPVETRALVRFVRGLVDQKHPGA